MLIILFACSSNFIKAQDTLSIKTEEKISIQEYAKENLDYISKLFGEKVIKSNPRLSNPFGINFNLGGQTAFLSLSVDYFVTSSLDIEAGTGLMGTFGGLKYHFDGANNDKNWTPYLGVYVAKFNPDFFWSHSSNPRNCIYTPLGIQFQKNKGLTFGAEIAYTNLNIRNVWGGLKFGYHF